MKNKKIWLGLIILVFVFALTSCEDLFTVPDWAQGKWYLTSVGGSIRPVAVEITDKEFIPKEELQNPAFTRKEVTVVTDTSVVFDVITVKKSGSNITIEITGGLGGNPITLYK